MDILNFSLAVGKLKQIKRTGWIREKIADPESVADHSFAITMLALAIAEHPQITCDTSRLLVMALLHDLGEIGQGDVVIDRGSNLANNQLMSKKNNQEALVIQELFLSLNSGNKYNEIFQEFIQQKSLESQLIKQLDKLEMVMQAFIYEKQEKKLLPEFYENARMYIKHPVIKEIFNSLLVTRDNYFSNLDKKMKKDNTNSDC